MYRETTAPLIVTGISASATARATLTARAEKIIITAKGAAVYARLGATAAASAGFYIPADVPYEMYPAHNTILSFLGIGTAAGSAYIQEII